MFARARVRRDDLQVRRCRRRNASIRTLRAEQGLAQGFPATSPTTRRAVGIRHGQRRAGPNADRLSTRRARDAEESRRDAPQGAQRRACQRGEAARRGARRVWQRRTRRRCPTSRTTQNDTAQRIAKLRQAVQLHERNVEALQQGARPRSADVHALTRATGARRRRHPVAGSCACSRRRRPSLPATGSTCSRPPCCCSMPTAASRYANPAAENLFELSRQKLVGHTLAELFGDCAALARRSSAPSQRVRRTPSRSSSSASAASRSCT